MLPSLNTLALGVVGLALAGALGAAGGYRYRDSSCDAAAAREEADQANQRVDAANLALAAANAQILDANNRQAAAEKARDEAVQAVSRARTARDGARAERERLRDDITRAEARAIEGSDAEPAGGTDGLSAVTGKLLGECASRYEAVAGDAGDLAARLSGLQSWVSATR